MKKEMESVGIILLLEPFIHVNDQFVWSLNGSAISLLGTTFLNCHKWMMYPLMHVHSVVDPSFIPV